jgi:hypothetical protein
MGFKFEAGLLFADAAGTWAGNRHCSEARLGGRRVEGERRLAFSPHLRSVTCSRHRRRRTP